jgi:DNA-binding response OmpR family regulator
MGATADRAVRASLVTTATQLAEQARVLDEEAQLLRAENSALREVRDQLLALLTAVNRTLGSRAVPQRRRRSSAPAVDPGVPPDAERSAPVVLDRAHRRLVVGSNAIPMSPREFDLLSHLLAHLGQPLAAEALARAVWPCPFEGDLRSVRVHVSTIRAKLEQFVGLPFRIATVYRVGYRAEPVDDGVPALPD